MNSINIIDVMTADVFLFLEPESLVKLRSSHRHMQKELQFPTLRRFFALQVEALMATAPVIMPSATQSNYKDPQSEESEAGQCTKLQPMLDLASAVETSVQVIKRCIKHPKMVDFATLREALGYVKTFSVGRTNLEPRDWSGKPTVLSRKLLRKFATWSGLIPALLDLVKAFSPDVLPKEVFLTICEVLGSVLHNSVELKEVLIRHEGLPVIVNFVKKHISDLQVVEGGLALFLALSARSEVCIWSMASLHVHKLAAKAWHDFPKKVELVARATGLLANMSNIRRVCPLLHKHGVDVLATKLIRSEEATKTVTIFVERLLGNMAGAGCR